MNHEPSGRHESVWLATTPTTEYAPLDAETRVDTAVVGGGIAGLTTAAKLREAGQSVALIERDSIAAAVTGHTTAKLTALHGQPYKHISDHFGEDAAKQYAAANQAAIDDIATTTEKKNIDCDFTRRTAYTYVTEQDSRSRVREEVTAAKLAGVDASFRESTELPMEIEGAVAVENQASFHPRKYLLALAEEIPGEESYIFEDTAVTDVRDASPCTVETDRGKIKATDVVVATHFPIVDKGLYFSRLSPKRSYVLAARLEDTPPQGMHYCPEEPYFSVRPAEYDGDQLVLFGGQNHRTGEDATPDRYRKLAEAVREHFAVESIEYRWSTQDFKTSDGVPFIGPLAPQTNNLYVATGFGGWGMTNATAGAMILRDLILGRPNDWAELFSPTRVNVTAGATEFLSHNTKTARHSLTRVLSRSANFDGDSLASGEADVFDIEDDKVAVYRDEEDELHAVSAICPHMGCELNWNDADRSWDCPCHGSRFNIDGSILDTPAKETPDQYDIHEPETLPDLESQ